MLDNDLMIDQIAHYLGNPMDNRLVTEFCKDSNFAVQSYYTYYYKNKDKIDYEAERIRKHYLSHIRNMSMKALVNRLNKSDKALQLALEITGLYTPRTEVNQTITDDTQKKARLEALIERYKAKKSETKKADSVSDDKIIENNQP